MSREILTNQVGIRSNIAEIDRFATGLEEQQTIYKPVNDEPGTQKFAHTEAFEQQGRGLMDSAQNSYTVIIQIKLLSKTYVRKIPCPLLASLRKKRTKFHAD